MISSRRRSLSRGSQEDGSSILAPSFSALIDSPFLLNSVLISRNDVSAREEEEEEKEKLQHEESEDNSEDKKSISDHKHVGEYMKNLYVNNDGNDQEEDYIKKSQDLMKSIRNGKVIEYEDVSNEHLSSPRDTIVVGKGSSDIGSERFALKSSTETLTEKSEKPSTEKKKEKKEKRERRDSGKNENSIIDTIFSPFSWIVGTNSSKRSGEEKKIKTENEKTGKDSSTTTDDSSQSNPTLNNNENSTTEEKKQESSSIFSTIFSSSLFSSNKKNPEPTQSEEAKIERKERKSKSSPLAWIERFGADAGKAASNALKDPLERLASSPVLATGEVMVVHSLDLDGIDFRRIFKYFIFMVFTWRFSNTFFGSIFPALLGRSSKRRIQQQSTPQIAYIPQNPSQYPSISILPRNSITQL